MGGATFIGCDAGWVGRSALGNKGNWVAPDGPRASAGRSGQKRTGKPKGATAPFQQRCWDGGTAPAVEQRLEVPGGIEPNDAKVSPRQTNRSARRQGMRCTPRSMGGLATIFPESVAVTHPRGRASGWSNPVRNSVAATDGEQSFVGQERGTGTCCFLGKSGVATQVVMPSKPTRRRKSVGRPTEAPWRKPR